MAIVAITVKIMPASPSIDLEKLKVDMKSKIAELGGTINKEEIQPVAFGLNCVILLFVWDENKDPDVIESELAKIEGVSSVQITDVRRTVG